MISNLTIDTRSDGIATVTLNRPEVHNAFDDEVIAELTQAFRRLAADPAARVVVLRANGKSFSAGADLDWMQRVACYSHAQNAADAMALAEMLHALAACPKPTLALVQGPAYGGGVGLVAACDIAVAAETASFALTEVRLGLIVPRPPRSGRRPRSAPARSRRLPAPAGYAPSSSPPARSAGGRGKSWPHPRFLQCRTE